MQWCTLTLAAAVAAALGPLAASAALASAGLGTFTSATTGRWLYYDTTTDVVRFGSYASNSPPATVFNLSTSATKGNFRVLATDNGRFLSSGNGSGVARASSLTAGTYNIFNLSANADGTTFYVKAWNGGWAKTRYGAMDSEGRLGFSVAAPKDGAAPASAAVKFSWNPSPYRTLQTKGGLITYRTLSTGTSASAFKYNVSTFFPALSGASGPLTAYTVKWAGDAQQGGRPMLMYLGGSDARSNEVTQETDVLDKTQSTGFPKVLSFNETLARSLLGRALLVVPASATCFNTTAGSWTDNACGTEAGNHFVKHYRPWELKRIYDDVLKRFTFDATRFALAGTGMGGRGGLRFAIEYPQLPSAVSMVSGALETNASTYIHAQPYVPWNSGEGCWDARIPNSAGDKACAAGDTVRPTMAAAGGLAGFPIRLWSSRYDRTDTLEEAEETCAGVNAARGGNCTVIDTQAATHQAMAYFGRAVSDVDWLLAYRRPAGQHSQLVR